MTATPEQIAMARRIAMAFRPLYRAMAARAALAAIIETTERAAKLVDEASVLAVFRGETCSEDMAAEYGFEDDFAKFLAVSIRRGDQLKGPEQ